jgi:hypothetical protein
LGPFAWWAKHRVADGRIADIIDGSSTTVEMGERSRGFVSALEHRYGRESLSPEDRDLLERVSVRYRSRLRH